MDATSFFLTAYELQRPQIAPNMLLDLTEEQIRVAPAAGVNTIAWLVWHIARTEDVVVNRFVGDAPQVFDEGDWGRRLNVARRDFGVAHSLEDVRQVSVAVDLDALRAYWDAVGEATPRAVRQLDPGRLAEAVPPEHVDRVIRQEGISLDAAWVYDWVHGFWSGKLRGFMLSYYALGHHLLHRGEANAIRGLMGHPGR